jgi:hypothetical protein
MSTASSASSDHPCVHPAEEVAVLAAKRVHRDDAHADLAAHGQGSTLDGRPPGPPQRAGGQHLVVGHLLAPSLTRGNEHDWCWNSDRQ